MPNPVEYNLLRSFSDFRLGLPIEGPDMERKLQELRSGEGSFAFNGKEYTDPEGNHICKGVRQDIRLTCQVEGIFRNRRLIMDVETFPDYQSIDLTRIKCVVDQHGNTCEGEFRFGKLFKGTMHAPSGESYTGEFDIKGRLLNVPYLDLEATLPDPVPEEPPAASFHLHLSFSDDSVPGSYQL